MSADLAGIPPLAQALAYTAVGVVTLLTARGGIIKGKSDGPSTTAGADLVAASFRDDRALAMLAETVARIDGRVERIERHADSLERCAEVANAALRDLTHAAREAAQVAAAEATGRRVAEARSEGADLARFSARHAYSRGDDA